MKRFFSLVVIALAMITFFISCARGISPYEAANGKARCGKNWVR